MLAASRVQHAIRLLALLRQAGEAAGAPTDPPEAALVIRSELRLQALDFWLRNPDYLADELVTEVETGRLDTSYLDGVEGPTGAKTTPATRARASTGAGLPWRALVV